LSHRLGVRSTFRGSRRWWANGARIRLSPKGLGGQSAGTAQDGPAEARSDQDFGKKVSLADLIVLGGSAAVEKAAKDAGVDVKVPYTPGRMDASQEQTDADPSRRSSRVLTASALSQQQAVHGA
jgi:catalase-peroxidase